MVQGTDQSQAQAQPPDSKTAHRTEQIDLLETWLGMAASQTNDLFWEYDLDTHEMHTFTFDDAAEPQERTLTNFPDSFLESGSVHPDSIDTVRALFESMSHGTVEGSANFLTKDPTTNNSGWSALTYRMQFDDAGRPVKARGMRRTLAGDPSTPGNAPSHFPVPDTIFPNLIRHLQANAYTGALDYTLVHGVERTGKETGSSYDEAMRKGATQLFRKEDESLYLDQCSRSRSLERLSQGRRWMVHRYRMVDSNGKIKPIQLSVNAIRNRESGETTVLTFLSSIDQKNAWETASPKTARRDPETQLYERHDSDVLVETIAKSCPESSLWAITMIRLAGVDELAERDASAAQTLVCDLASAIGVFLDTDAVACRYDRCTIGAFLPDVSSGADVHRRIQTALSAVRASLSDAPGLDEVHLIAGTVCGRMGDFDLQSAIEHALSVCDAHVDRSTDITLLARFAEESEETSGAIAARFNRAQPPEVLGFADEHAYVCCLQSMLQADSPGSAINAALAELGKHYEADRTYLLAVSNSGRTLSVLFEQAPQGRPSIKQPFSGRSIDQFPLIKHYMNTERTVLVSKANTLSFDGADDSPSPWNFAIVPLPQSPDSTMLLCLENPREHLGDWALAEHVAPYILSTWIKLAHGQSSTTSDIASRMPMPGVREFECALGHASSGQHSSLGVLAIDIPNPVGLVESRSFAYAIDTAILIRRELADAFGCESVFCTGESELIALCADTVYDAFIQRCAQVRRALARSCPREFRIGSAWAGTGFNAGHLVRDARMVMLRDETDPPVLPEFAATPFGAGSERTAESCQRSHERFGASSIAETFDVYLQPKIDMRTGAVVGAEALARVFDENGTAITPSATIAQMEQDGSIRELDYFVFDRTLSLMSEWQEKGLRAISVSSNFSRSTLLGSSALASVLAIMSRYPNIPSDMVEMEVTETACDLDRSTLSNIVERFRENGLRIVLDDFGARFSNAAMLANASFDAVKIDRSLVTDICTNPVSRMLVRNIVEICNERSMECIAEGIETREQAGALIEEGCRTCQGFYYDKPMPASVFERKYLFGSNLS